MSIDEQLFWNKSKSIIFRPFSAVAKIVCRARSFLLQKALVDFGADESFMSAVEKVKEHYGVTVASSTTRLDVEKHAHAIHEQIDKKEGAFSNKDVHKMLKNMQKFYTIIKTTNLSSC